MYKIKDNQGDLMSAYTFNSIDEVIEHLANFHNNDYEELKEDGTRYKDIYEFLDNLKTWHAKIDFLCDYGDWRIIEVIDCNDCKAETEKTEAIEQCLRNQKKCMTPTNTHAEELAKAIKIMEFIEQTRLTTCPKDYPPSEWQQYQRVTKDIKEARIKLSEIYMLL